MLDLLLHNPLIVMLLALIAVVGIISSAVVNVTRARSGHDPGGSYLSNLGMGLGLGDEDEVNVRQVRALEAKLTARDRELTQLKDRVPVLERIVTDRANQLNEELSALQRGAPGNAAGVFAGQTGEGRQDGSV